MYWYNIGDDKEGKKREIISEEGNGPRGKFVIALQRSRFG